ncbi:MAG TPA: MFS transporter [Candidatus Dormibacteraeota bacterium]|nr:MFS transporter [Candidatus Dormibacteraeota bacterium]
MVRTKTKPTHKNLILTIVALAQFMVVLDVSIVNVALPSIYKALHFTSTSNLQWVVTAYTLAFGGFLLLGGRAADLFGRKKVFISGVSIFALASLFTGMSINSQMIEITRGIQGLAAAFMSPAALSIVITTFKEGHERNVALSIWGGIAAGGAATGVLLGGILTQYLNWRWNFFVNVPVGILVILAAMFYIDETDAGLDHKQLDLKGALMVTTGLIALVYGFTQAPTIGWSSHRVIEYFGASFILLIGFVVNELKSKHPLVPFSIFKISNIAAANLTQLPITASLYSMFFFISLYVQQVLHYSPIKTGLGFIPVSIVIGVMASQMSKVIKRFGYKRILMVAPIFMASGLYWLSRIRANGNYFYDVLPGLIVVALGLGMVFVAITVAATTGVPKDKAGLASGLLNTSQQIGGAIGLAILSGVSASKINSYLSSHAHSGNVVSIAQVYGSKYAFLTGVVFAIIALSLATFLIKEDRTKKVVLDPSINAGL